MIYNICYNDALVKTMKSVFSSEFKITEEFRTTNEIVFTAIKFVD